MDLKQEWRSFIIDEDIYKDLIEFQKKSRFNGKDILSLIEKYAIKFAEKLR